MYKFAIIILYLFITSVCYSQVIDDFSDGDFSGSPAWSGSTSQFIVNTAHQLQLSNTVAGTSYLSTAFSSTTLNDYEWLGYVKQSFAPSGSNFGRVYLVSDQANLSQPLNGYYLQFGEAGSNDAVELFRQSGSTSVSVCRATNGAIAGSFALRYRVTRDNTGGWKLYLDYLGGNNFALEASGTDAILTSGSYFGVLCTYTASNAAKFYYDDFSVGPIIKPDTTPPTVKEVRVLSSSSLSVLFSEAVDPISSQTVANYTVNNNVHPSTGAMQADGKSIELTFSTAFANGLTNQLTIASVKDLAGNEMAVSSFPFLYFQSSPVQRKDILFTELLPDPSPQVGLPNVEYIEIYNRSVNPIDIGNWDFSDGVTHASLPSTIVLPGQYWIVTASANAGLFSGRVVGVSNFPTLNNSGDYLTLKSNGQTIDSIHYTLDWYHDVDKQEGGWALELIDPDNICGEMENWTASEDASGGTPGKQNSVFANKPDLTGPKLTSLAAVSDSVLILNFDEKLEKALAQVSFFIDPAIAVSTFSFTDASLRQIKLELPQKLQPRIVYEISVSNLTDCAGNFIQADFSKLSFVLPETADSLDIVINEILFNPRSGGVDFVEIYNRSAKFINLNGWSISNFDDSSVRNPKIIFSTDFVLSPGSYLAFTPDPALLTSQYPQAVQSTLAATSLPSFPDTQGSVALVSDKGKVIDFFSYNQNLHSSFLKDVQGVSLERVSFAESSQETANWKSANASAGFATPGYLNSNARPETTLNKNTIVLQPEIFSPATPGLDFAKINYRFDQSGIVANVKVLDAQGRLIKTLANNETLAFEGFYRWDGDRDDGSHARSGYYLVWFETFDAAGTKQVFRKRAVISK